MAPRVKYIDAYDSLDLIKKDKEKLEAVLPDKMEEVSQKLALSKQPTSKYSMNDAMVTGVASLIPMILGAALAGKKGAGYGAKAGAAGAANYTKVLTANKQAENDLAAAEAKLGLSDYTATQKRAQQLGDTYNKGGIDLAVKAENAADVESRFNRHEAGINSRHQESEANRAAGKNKEDEVTPMDPTIVAELADRKGVDVDDIVKELSLPKEQFEKLNKYKYAEGLNVRPVSSQTENKIEAAKQFERTLEKMKALVNSFDPKDQGLLNALKAGRATGAYKDPSSPVFKFYALSAVAKKTYARTKDSGALTNQDTEMFAPLIEGSPTYDSVQTIKDRLLDLQDMSRGDIKNIIDVQKASGRRTSGLEKMMKSAPPEEAKTDIITMPNPADYKDKAAYLEALKAYNAD